MMRANALVGTLLLGLVATAANAQQRSSATDTTRVVVRTVPLHHLSSGEATKLLSPYVRASGGGVYDAGPNVHAVTIRESQAVYNEMMSVLAKYDHEPATIALDLQLVAGYGCDTCGLRVNGRIKPTQALPDGIDTLVKKVLKYKRYRLLATTTAVVDEDSHVSQSMVVDGDPMHLEVSVRDVRFEETGPAIVVDGVVQKNPPTSVHLSIALSEDMVAARGAIPGRAGTLLFSSGVSVPIGQTVVLGSAVGALPNGSPVMQSSMDRKRADAGDDALILIVRPRLVSTSKKDN